MEDNILTLHGPDNTELKFEPIAEIALGKGHYVILSPLNDPALPRDRALVFSVSKAPNGQAALNIVTEQPIIDAVFDEYHAMMERKFEEQAKRPGTESY